MRRLFGAVNKKLLSVGQEFFWRSGRDSNPRAAFDDNTISSQDELLQIRQPFDINGFKIFLVLDSL